MFLIDQCEEKEHWCAYKVDCSFEEVKSKCPKHCGLCDDSKSEPLFSGYKAPGNNFSNLSSKILNY